MIVPHKEIKHPRDISSDLRELTEDLEAYHAFVDSAIRISEEDQRRLSWVLENVLKDWSREKIDHRMNKKG